MSDRRTCRVCGYYVTHAPDECPARLYLAKRSEQEREIKAAAYEDPEPSPTWRAEE